MASLSSELGCGAGRPRLAVLLVHGPVFVEQDLHERLLDVLQSDPAQHVITKSNME